MLPKHSQRGRVTTAEEVEIRKLEYEQRFFEQWGYARPPIPNPFKKKPLCQIRSSRKNYYVKSVQDEETMYYVKSVQEEVIMLMLMMSLIYANNSHRHIDIRIIIHEVTSCSGRVTRVPSSFVVFYDYFYKF